MLKASPRAGRALQQRFVTGFVAALWFSQYHLYNLLTSPAAGAVFALPLAWSLLLHFQPEESLVCLKAACAALIGHGPVPASLSITGEKWFKRVVHGENPLCSFGKQAQRCMLVPWAPPEAQAEEANSGISHLNLAGQCLMWPGNGNLWERTLKTLKNTSKGCCSGYC